MSFNPYRNALEPGCRLHWYTLHEVLGQGGFGITYLAHDPNLNQSVAIKEYFPADLSVRGTDRRVHPVSAQRRGEFNWGLQRFVTEGRTLSRFDHPNLVRVLAVFELNCTAYMVMGYEDGQSLREMLPARATLDEQWLKRMVLPVIDGLSQVHAAGFIHRDIKPDNLFIRDDHTPVLLDFGSARQALGQGTRTLTAVVSPGYAPFEQYHAKSDHQGPWTDIYGLGATLYRAATGQAPMDAIERSESLLREGKDPYVPAAELIATRCTPAFLAAIDHALAFREQDRPQALLEWARELRGEVHARNGAASPASPAAARTPLPSRGNRPKPGRPARRKRPASRLGKRSTALGLLGVLLFGFVAAMQRTQPHASPEPPQAALTAPAIAQGVAKSVDVELARAWDALGDLRLVGADDDNAAARYREVLEAEPRNRAALSGLRTIFDYYRELGRRAARLGQMEQARGYIHHALGVAPDPDTVTAAQAQLDSLGV